MAVVLLVAWIGVTRGPEVLAAIASCPPWVLVGATFAHALTLALRTEAWRTVLRGTGAGDLGHRLLHSANAGAFLAGTVQGSAALATRIVLIRRLGGDRAPSVAQITLADAPILMLEVCTSALLAAVASTTVPAIPAWVPWAIFVAALAGLGVMRQAYGRLRHRPSVAGLAVLASARLRARLTIVVLAFTGMALLRTWIVLMGFGLPSDPADVCLVLFSMGVVGLLPIGVGTGPTATVAALGATDLAAATAAGMVVSAATVLAVLIYALACWSINARVEGQERAGDAGDADVIPFPAASTAEAGRGLDLAA
ncbi:MAG TPA: hypothetical protein VI035_06610 [Solirubrobacterales bacterium]